MMHIHLAVRSKVFSASFASAHLLGIQSLYDRVLNELTKSTVVFAVVGYANKFG